jgi:hypothetical protein
MPLAAGVPVTDSAWLSQLVYGIVSAWGGGEALSLLFVATVLATCLVLARTFYLQSRSLVATNLGLALVCTVGWSRISAAHSEMLGMFCFAVLLWLLMGDRAVHVQAPLRAARLASDRPDRASRVRWGLWIGIPVLMALWANLHDSFVGGLLALGCWMCGVTVETAWRERSLWGVIGDASVRRWIGLGELAVGAVCLNPYGVQLVFRTLWLPNREHLSDVPDWQRLVFLEPSGCGILLGLGLLMVLFRHSRRRIPVADFLLLVVFGLLACRGTRMVWWFAAVCGGVAVPHLADVCDRLRHLRLWPLRRTGEASTGAEPNLAGRRFWSLAIVAPVLCWVAFAVSPAGIFLMTARARTPDRLYIDTTPWKLSAYLHKNPPRGQTYNPHWWGDFLSWSGPPGLKLFMTTNMHLATPTIWIDQRIIRETRTGWPNVLERYGVETVILDRHRQTTLQRYLRESRDWRVEYEDDVAVVFQVKPGKRSSTTNEEKPEPRSDLQKGVP